LRARYDTAVGIAGATSRGRRARQARAPCHPREGIDVPPLSTIGHLARGDQKGTFEQAPSCVQFGVKCVVLLFPDPMKRVRQLERATKFEPVELALEAFDSREVVKTRNDVVEGLGLYRADSSVDVVS
jgi:hypothetical protein